MDLRRRQLCKYVVVSGLAGGAGCQTSGPAVETVEEPDSDSDLDANEPVQTIDREFGETVRLKSGDGEQLAVTPTNARLASVFFEGESADISSVEPETRGQVFLEIAIDVENTGGGVTDLPDEISFRADGSEYGFDEYANPRGSYDELENISPGSTYEALVTFEIPVTASEGELVLSSEHSFDTIVNWSLDLDTVTRDPGDYTDLSIGTGVTVGRTGPQFSFTVASVETMQEYTYTSSGQSETHVADDGKQFVRVTVSAENTGTGRVKLPRPSVFTLIAGSSQYEHSAYGVRGETYTGGLLSEGVQTEAELLFEIPEDHDPSRVEIELVDGLLGTWTV
ncbi:DUF4352 domain-containing protein [Halomicroarcula sp. F28]|uniref:DUF4352 domain-containing protein n=1 Tax=Haloarcula salinisoli TaxID=2487746 RepID=UPI001C7304B0|nr:DUF4352 domain-containing protein [Halomicroarcula salinisoli]MBX0285940.1 DUF4352 domain-containing protein [Halomicroarcula salinisoli]